MRPFSRKAGIIRIRSVEEFGDISKAFLSLPPVKGDRIGIDHSNWGWRNISSGCL